MLAASALAVAGPSPAGGTSQRQGDLRRNTRQDEANRHVQGTVLREDVPTPPLAETVVTGPGNTLENVVVYHFRRCAG